MSEANAHAENSKPGGASGKPPAGATKEPSAADAAHLFVFCNSKAGMGKVDKDKVNAIVMEMSKNSPYYKHELRQAEKAGKEIDAMRAKVARLSQGELARAKQLADRAERRLEASRYYDRVCCVCDMDMFFAAVEIRDRPELRDLPIAVGGGVVCTANYVARQYGVRSAMPGFIAQRLCPQLVTVRCNFDKYTAVSREIQAIFLQYDKNMVAASLDEAYLDLTEVVKARAQEANVAIPPTHRALLPGEKHPGDKKAGGEGTGDEADEMDQLEEEEEDEEVQEREGEGEQLPGAGEGMGTAYGHEYEGYWAIADAVVKEIRMRIFEQTRLTASAGIGSSFVLAKIAADMRKPFDQYRVTDIETFLHDLPIRKICGIGRVTERVLGEALGIQTCGQLYEQRALLFACFRPGTASWFLSRSMGLGSIRDEEDSGKEGRKGISREETFRAISEPELLLSKCRELCVALAKDLETSGLEGRTLTLKLKNTEFDVMSRSHTLGHNISSAEDMNRVAAKLLEAEMPIALRLMGVRMSKLRKTGSDKNSLDAYLHNNSTATSPGKEGQGGADAPAKPSTIRVCPLCTKPLKGLSNGQVNEHIDRCLEVANAGDAEDGGKEGEEEEGGFVRERSAEGKGKSVQTPQMRDGGVPAHPWGGGGREKAVQGGTIVSCFRPPQERAKTETRPQAQKSVPQEPDRASEEALKAEGEQQEVPMCPVCDACLRGMNNAALNAHLDGCLGEGAAGSSAARKRKVEEPKGRQGSGGKKKAGKTGSAQAGIAPIQRFFAPQPGSSSGR